MMAATEPTVRATVAPGCYVQLAHPSGLQGLASYTLYAGETFDASPEQAQRFYDRGTILHPVTGQPKPPHPEPAGVTITVNGRVMSAGDPMAGMEMSRVGREYAERENARRDAERIAREAAFPKLANPKVTITSDREGDVALVGLATA